MKEPNEEQWQELSTRILTDIREWRRSHPKATLAEIEEEVHRRMSQLEAQVIEDTAHTSAFQCWSGKPAHERPCCPICRTPLQTRGKHMRTLQAAGGHDITLKREYGTCPTCGTGLFPPG
ncbi:hypothetical protein KTT_29850 [Tengunoibacter tsumagoiensis]|uniref:Uncharacterized protein n=1 Tax=Tengunoibacter tsumagoiensis TaxID=2014871 RepID=A0A401ZVM5_9CHLR|nr:hypothetical protein [Tengunoibacter tsumagoiensis]GCE10943.1 hypothetical protein KTT_08020 [Tengunoibacter tsumagoiensis]GCE13126.1 hypothetical protein KTT_29850 [Tengunoibacter tsumagoiensis]